MVFRSRAWLDQWGRGWIKLLLEQRGFFEGFFLGSQLQIETFFPFTCHCSRRQRLCFANPGSGFGDGTLESIDLHFSCLRLYEYIRFSVWVYQEERGSCCP